MKTLLSLAGVLVLFTHTARALTEVHQITSENDCPSNLKIRVEPAQAGDDLVVISVTLTPRAPEAYRGRVMVSSHLQVASRGRTVFDGELETTQDDGVFRCHFRVHADSLDQSRLTVSSRLYELDGHPTLGGGEIYEISLRGFAPSVAGMPNRVVRRHLAPVRFPNAFGLPSMDSMTTINEIAPDVFRLSLYVPAFDMQFNHFLVRDEEPLLFHAGLKAMFPELRETVATLIDPAKLRHIAWSHFESDECGALNDWLQLAPMSQPVCTLVGKLVSVDDFSIRPARGMTSEDVLSTGKYRYRFHRSPHIPHGWDAGVLFEEERRTLFCSDLFHHFGNVAPMTSSDLIEPTRKAMQQMQQGPLAGYMPYTRHTEGVLRSLADLKPETLAVMHGSSYRGQGDRLLTDLAGVIKENFDQAEPCTPPNGGTSKE